LSNLTQEKLSLSLSVAPKIMSRVPKAGLCLFALRFYRLILDTSVGVRAEDEINKTGKSPRVLATSGSH